MSHSCSQLSRCREKMATAELESVAEFKRRASALGVTDDHLKALVAAGFDTFDKYAFAVPYVPCTSC